MPARNSIFVRGPVSCLSPDLSPGDLVSISFVGRVIRSEGGGLVLNLVQFNSKEPQGETTFNYLIDDGIAVVLMDTEG